MQYLAIEGILRLVAVGCHGTHLVLLTPQLVEERNCLPCNDPQFHVLAIQHVWELAEEPVDRTTVYKLWGHNNGVQMNTGQFDLSSKTYLHIL